MEILILIYTFVEPYAISIGKGREKCQQINTLNTMKKFIKVSPEVRDELCAKYGVSKMTIWEALSFITRNKRGQAIRKDALERGGRYFEEDFVPQCSFHRTPDGWTQKFAGGVLVTVAGSDVVITKGLDKVASFEEVTMDGFSNILAQAQQLAEKGMMEIAN